MNMTVNEGWLTQVRRLDSPNFNQRPDGSEPSLLVIHNISLPPGVYGGNEVDDFFLNRLDHDMHPFFDEIRGVEVSAHFYIRRDGRVTQFVSCLDRAWHAGVSTFCGRENCNDYSIGVELEGQDDDAFTDAQYESLVHLTRALMDEYPIVSKDNIVGHSDIAPERKTDPGPMFDWNRYFSMI
ncbi:N-acetyl-anhydromuranmyl-L-alanine amidase [Oleiphilus sp. HI0009]|nr:N-acetyl-anhydromuranmyl-L-alanine amidase [Oleiphilus sp. HI0009]KZY66153.1 N-acetyl-anhydromuranmyl-L-alanine amidase [Oleiphilus sp. HI0066]KZY72702.1 N-acetyl-anhydromuranmyl-L-alanine amidase [Oleiphilus sp. HI0067]KZZ55684.1 N-acetyl-anhydromuranmyl-L-alanine amidase [Oleiphilus sp. HI0125]